MTCSQIYLVGAIIAIVFGTIGAILAVVGMVLSPFIGVMIKGAFVNTVYYFARTA